MGLFFVFFGCVEKILSQKSIPKTENPKTEASLPQLSSGKLNLVEKCGKKFLAMLPQKPRCYRCVSRVNDTASNRISPFQALKMYKM